MGMLVSNLKIVLIKIIKIKLVTNQVSHSVHLDFIQPKIVIMFIISLEEVSSGTTVWVKSGTILTASYLKNNSMHWLENKVKPVVYIQEINFLFVKSYNRIE